MYYLLRIMQLGGEGGVRGPCYIGGVKGAGVSRIRFVGVSTGLVVMVSDLMVTNL